MNTLQDLNQLRTDLENTLAKFIEIGAIGDREKKETELAVMYSLTLNHGTSGHLAYNTIAKLAFALIDVTKAGTQGLEMFESTPETAELPVDE